MRRDERLSLAMNGSELGVIRAAADAEGIPLGIWARRELLRAAK